MSTVVPWVQFGVLVSREVIVWVVKHLMSVSLARGGYGHHLSHIHRLSAHLWAVYGRLFMDVLERSQKVGGGFTEKQIHSSVFF